MRLYRRTTEALRDVYNSSGAIIIIGSLLVVFVATLVVVYLPLYTIPDEPSAAWRPLTPIEERGRLLYIANGCTYCHSQYVRPQDWAEGAERIAQAGDYHQQMPHLLGSQRTGPDLSQEGGERTNDWQRAHFINPRFTRPRSLMPRFAYVGEENIEAMIAYVQSLGGKLADERVARQRHWNEIARAAFRRGPDENIRWLHSMVPRPWRAMPSETPATEASIKRGEKVYQDFCIGCHGPVGDGNGPAAPFLDPPPLNFTILRRHLIDNRYIGGILYYQIMNGITGTSMPYHKKDLESAKIWDVGNFIMVNFINHRDDLEPRSGIPVPYESEEHAAPVIDEPLTEPTGPPLGGQP